MNTNSNTNANENNVGDVAEENKNNKLERGTGSRNLTKNKKNQKGGKRRTRRNRKD